MDSHILVFAGKYLFPPVHQHKAVTFWAVQICDNKVFFFIRIDNGSIRIDIVVSAPDEFCFTCPAVHRHSSQAHRLINGLFQSDILPALDWG